MTEQCGYLLTCIWIWTLVDNGCAGVGMPIAIVWVHVGASRALCVGRAGFVTCSIGSFKAEVFRRTSVTDITTTALHLSSQASPHIYNNPGLGYALMEPNDNHRTSKTVLSSQRNSRVQSQRRKQSRVAAISQVGRSLGMQSVVESARHACRQTQLMMGNTVLMPCCKYRTPSLIIHKYLQPAQW